MSRKSIAVSTTLCQSHSSILSFVLAIMRSRSRCVLVVDCPNQAAIFPYQEVVPNDRELWVRQQPGSRLRDVVITHPTMAEGLVALFSNVPAT